MRAFQMPLSTLPIRVTFLENGCLIFDRIAKFQTVIDHPEDGVCAIISNEDIYIGADIQINYGEVIDYKSLPELLSWLISHKLILPTIQGF